MENKKFRWTAFVRATNIEEYVEMVEFKLHHTFKQPIRQIKEAPFETTNTGWGWFELPITINFKKETGIQPVTVNHKLEFANGGEARSIKVLL